MRSMGERQLENVHREIDGDDGSNSSIERRLHGGLHS